MKDKLSDNTWLPHEGCLSLDTIPLQNKTSPPEHHSLYMQWRNHRTTIETKEAITSGGMPQTSLADVHIIQALNARTVAAAAALAAPLF